MENYLWNHRITPRVLKKGVMQTIEIEGLDDSYLFYDGIEYEVRLVCRDYHTLNKEFSTPPKHSMIIPTLKVKSKDNKLKITYNFDVEGLWRVYIRCLENVHHTKHREYYWPWSVNEREILVTVYVLDDDLYGLTPFKGDLHVHSMDSDGDQSPRLMATKYRKYGFDFIAMTDHYTMQPSLDIIEKFKEIPTNFILFSGEEVHTCQPKDAIHSFHVVNFGGKSSVNQLLKDDYKGIEKKVLARAEEIKDEVLDFEEAVVVAWHEWVYNRIKESGGVAIYAHPFWEVYGSFYITESATKQIIKRGLLDAIEVYGGLSKQTNLMQEQMYHHMKELGYKMSPVGSSDAHSNICDEHFDSMATIVFAKDKDDITSAVMDGRTVAIEKSGSGVPSVCGDLRLVKYAWFLLNDYYVRHDELCNASGQAIERYMYGDKEQKLLIELLEKEVKKYQDGFFGFTK
jgi:predicted metal-dependent phosphoesterase TrpH